MIAYFKSSAIFVPNNNKKINKMTTFTISIEQLEVGHAKEMSKIAKETVTAKLYENGDLFLFGSELACLRIAQANRQKETKVNYSENLKTFYVAIYSGK